MPLYPPPAATVPPLVAGQYFLPLSPSSTTTSNAIGNSVMRVAPWLVTKTVTVDRLSVDVSAAGEAGSKVRPVIYADNGNSFPGTLVVDGGQLAGDAIGTPEATIAATTLLPGLYWLGAAVQAATTSQPTVRCLGNHSVQGLIGQGTSVPAANGQVLGYAGTCTAAAPATFPGGSTGASTAPRLTLRAA